MVQTRSATAAQAVITGSKREATTSTTDKPPTKKLSLGSKYVLPTTIKVLQTDWRFGYAGKSKTRIIVTITDSNGTSWVHQYDKGSETRYTYYCVGCLNKVRIKNLAKFIDGTFYAPTFHDCEKVCAKKCAEEQLEKERKLFNYPMHFNPLYTFSKPRYQEFTFPTSFILYTIKNPKTSSIYDKLVKTCKWFYYRNHIALIQEFVAIDKNVDLIICRKWDMKHSIKYITYSKDLPPIIPAFTFNKPQCQEFSFPTSLIRYLICHPKTHKAYDKLVKSCKWFYHRNKLTLIQIIQRTKIGDDDDITVITPLPLEWDIQKKYV